MSRLEQQERARTTIEAHARASLATDHAVFTWSLADAIEAVFEHLSLPPGCPVAVPFAAPAEVYRALAAADCTPCPIATDPASLGLCPDALQAAFDRRSVGAVVAWRPAGVSHARDLAKVLAAATVPVIDASPRMPQGRHDLLEQAIATCVSLAHPTLPAAIVATDDRRLARLATEQRLGRAPAPSNGRDAAHLDRWASNTSLHLAHDLLTDPQVASSYELLVDAIAAAPEAHAVFGPVLGWGEVPTWLASFPHTAALEAAAARFADVGAVEITRWSDRTNGTAWSADGDPHAHVLTFRMTRAMTPDETRSVVSAGGPAVDRRTSDSRGMTGRRAEDRPENELGAPTAEPTEIRAPGLAVRAAKRTFDIVVGTLLIVASSPLMLAIAVLVRLAEGGPVIFRQVRVGRGGEHFVMLKFRTMIVGADEMIDLRLGPNEREGPLFKLTEDPRSTVVGKVLRRTSLDELPQLFNVLIGTMSLVGPRPALPAERVHFARSLRRRECVRPGITGLWQVEARDDASFERYAELDLHYIANCSFRLDAEILARTPRAVLATALRRPFRPQGRR